MDLNQREELLAAWKEWDVMQEQTSALEIEPDNDTLRMAICVKLYPFGYGPILASYHLELSRDDDDMAELLDTLRRAAATAATMLAGESFESYLDNPNRKATDECDPPRGSGEGDDPSSPPPHPGEDRQDP